nr:hypothetical protein [Tanacetum cinerariifolium]
FCAWQGGGSWVRVVGCGGMEQEVGEVVLQAMAGNLVNRFCAWEGGGSWVRVVGCGEMEQEVGEVVLQAMAGNLVNRYSSLNVGGERQVDGQVKTITEASVRRHLKLADADGISSLPTTKFFEQLALMGYVTDSDKLTFQKGDSPVQARLERLSNLPNELPLGEANTSRSGEGSMQYLELMEICTQLSEKVTSLENELTSTKAGRMIAKINKDENVNLVKSSKKGEAHKTVEHIIESEFSTISPQEDDDDTTPAETLLNIQRSAAKDKGKELAKETVRQEQEKYNIEKALELQKQLDERKEDNGDQAYDIDWSSPSVLRYHEFLKLKVWDQNHTFVHMDSKIEKEVMKRYGFDLQQERSKKQKLDEQAEVHVDSDQEEDEMKKYMKIVPIEKIAIDVIPLATKPLVIVDWKIINEGRISSYNIIRANES